MAQQYIAHAANPAKIKNEADGLKVAHALVDSCHFIEQHAEKLCLRVETDIIQAARGSKAAELYKTCVLDLDPARFSLRGEHAVTKIAKMLSGGKKGTKDDADGDDQEPSRKKRNKNRRKCVRCKKGPFTKEEFAEHSKTWKD